MGREYPGLPPDQADILHYADHIDNPFDFFRRKDNGKVSGKINLPDLKSNDSRLHKLWLSLKEYP